MILLASLALAGTPLLATREETLPNGLRVVVHQMRGTDRAALRLVLPVGAAADPPGLEGLTHLVEHVAFTGSANAPGNTFDQWLAAAGGESGGTTDRDAVVFTSEVAAEALPLALFLESDRLGWLTPTEAAVETQLAVVARELDLDHWDDHIWGGLAAALWPAGHPYARLTKGTRASLSQVTHADVRAFAPQVLRPDGATLVVVAPQAPDWILGEVRRQFADVPGDVSDVSGIQLRVPPPGPGGGVASHHDASVPVTHLDVSLLQVPLPPGPDRAWLPADIYGQAVRLAWPVPDVRAPVGTALSAAAWVLAQRLADAEVSVAHWAGREGGVFRLEGWTEDARGLVKRLEAAMATFRSEGPTDAELARWRGVTRTAELARLDRPAERAAVLAECLAATGEAGCVPTRWAARAAVKPADVRLAAERWLGEGRAVLVVAADAPPMQALTPLAPPASRGLRRPTATGRGDPEAEPPVRTRPAVPATGTPAPPEVRAGRMSGGADLWFVERDDVPVVRVELRLLTAGLVQDGQLGTGALAALGAAWAHGSRERGEAWAAAVEEGGGAWSVACQAVDCRLALTAPAEAVAGLVPLLGELVRAPALPADAHAAWRREATERWQADWQREHVVHRNAVARLLYVERDPGRLDRVRADVSVTHSAVRHAWRTVVEQAPALVVVVGAADEALRPALETAFGWLGGRTEWREPPLAVAGARTILVDDVSAEPARVTVVWPSPGSAHPDQPAWQLVANVLVGSFASRLNLRLREAEGLTYEVTAAYLERMESGHTRVELAVPPGRITDVLRGLDEELERMRVEGPSADELEGARRQAWSGGDAALRFAAADVVEALSYARFFRAPPTMLFARLTRYADVTLEQARAAAASWLAQPRVLVVTGDARVVRPSVEAAGWSSVETWTACEAVYGGACP